jgi:hypothetical protein
MIFILQLSEVTSQSGFSVSITEIGLTKSLLFIYGIFCNNPDNDLIMRSLVLSEIYFDINGLKASIIFKNNKEI